MLAILLGRPPLSRDLEDAPMRMESTQMAARRTFPVPPIWVAGAVIMSWLGLWVHEFYRVPAQFGIEIILL
jgi:hypothetical protein